MPINPRPKVKPRMRNKDPEIVQFEDGFYAIRKWQGDRYEFANLSGSDYWWEIGSGREYYASTDILKVEKRLKEIKDEAIEKQRKYELRKTQSKDNGIPFLRTSGQEIKGGSSLIGEKPQVYIGREVKKLKLPNFSKWFKD